MDTNLLKLKDQFKPSVSFGSVKLLQSTKMSSFLQKDHSTIYVDNKNTASKKNTPAAVSIKRGKSNLGQSKLHSFIFKKPRCSKEQAANIDATPAMATLSTPSANHDSSIDNEKKPLLRHQSSIREIIDISTKMWLLCQIQGNITFSNA